MIRRTFAKSLAALFASHKLLEVDKKEEIIEPVKHYEYIKPKNMVIPQVGEPRIVSQYDRWILINTAEPLHKGDLVAINNQGLAVRVGVDAKNIFGTVVEGGLATAIVHH